MSPALAVILVTVIYKLSCLTVGSLFCYLGYRLFKAGIWGNAGDLETKYKDMNIVLKSGAPGTFFAVLGAAIIAVTVWQGMAFNWQSGARSDSAPHLAPPPLPDFPKGAK